MKVRLGNSLTVVFVTVSEEIFNMANKAYKFRLYPTTEQEKLLVKTFDCVRFAYNKMLAKHEPFKDNKEALKKQKFPTPAKYKVLNQNPFFLILTYLSINSFTSDVLTLFTT
jgi:transposase